MDENNIGEFVVLLSKSLYIEQFKRFIDLNETEKQQLFKQLEKEYKFKTNWTC